MSYTEALRRIEKAAQQKSAKLNLSRLGLTRIPSKLWELKELKVLWLHNNHLSVLPAEVKQLVRLRRLRLRSNQFMALPGEIGELPALQLLCVAHNQLKELPKEIGQLSTLQYLWLDRNRLEKLPQSIGQLRALRGLELDYNHLKELPDEIGELSQLQRLNLENNQLKELSKEIGQLSTLQYLWLDRNRLEKLPQSIGQLRALRGLELDYNHLKELPDEVGELSQLQRLNLENNQLGKLPKNIGQLFALKGLGLDYNQLKELPKEICQLLHLERLDFDNNQLEELPKEIWQLSSLRKLSLWNNRLKELPREIGQLSSLQALWLSGNQLKELPKELGQLSKLRYLWLSDNQLCTLPREIGQLSALQYLWLSNNQLSMLPPEIEQLSTLSWFDLSSNQLKELPLELDKLAEHMTNNLQQAGDNDLGLFLGDNPLYTPVIQEILRRCHNEPKVIMDFYRAIQKTGKPINEAKILFVGDAFVGKTSLIKRLLTKKFDQREKQTDGIVIKKWAFGKRREICLNLWDFGGQEIMYATHQFFMTQRSIYVLVLSARECQQEEIAEKWLKLIRSLAGEKVPIIIVINKTDQHNLDLNRQNLKTKYGVQAFVKLSAKDNKGFDSFRTEIEEALKHLPHLHDCLPQSWFNLKKKLAKNKEDHMPYQYYVKFCEGHGVHDPNQQKVLVRLLHDLGTMLNFQENETNVLKPEWVTQGVYAILLSLKRKGQHILHFDMLDKLLDKKRYSTNEQRRFVIGMMQEFKLCFLLSDGKSYLIPELLPKEIPPLENLDFSDSLTLEYRYDSLHPAVLSRFIVKKHDFISENHCWLTGAILEYEGNQARIIADITEKRIRLSVMGRMQTRRPFLLLLCMDLEEVHKSFVNLNVEKWIYYKDVSMNKDFFIKYNDLEKAEQKGEREWFCPTLEKRIFVKEVLDGYREPKTKWSREETENINLGFYFGQNMRDRENIHFYFKPEVNQNMGDEIHISNSQNVNIQSSLHQVTQATTAFPNTSAQDNTELKELFANLKQLLDEVSQKGKKSEAEFIATQAEKLLDEAQKKIPCSFLKITGDGLIAAAQALADMADPVLEVVRKIVELVVPSSQE